MYTCLQIQCTNGIVYGLVDPEGEIIALVKDFPTIEFMLIVFNNCKQGAESVDHRVIN